MHRPDLVELVVNCETFSSCVHKAGHARVRSRILNNHEKDMLIRLEAMSLEQARKEITTGAFATIGSPNHQFVLSWLSGKEADLKDSREAKMLTLTKVAIMIAIAAMIIAMIAARKDIIWLISLFIKITS